MFCLPSKKYEFESHCPHNLFLKQEYRFKNLIILLLLFMPQLDLFTFFVQVFWSYLGFLTLYFSLKYYVLAPIAKVLKMRQKLLSTTKKFSSPKINIYW